MANVFEVSEWVPLDQLRLTAEWSRLTAKQSTFVSKYVQSGVDGEYNAIEAARSAYACSSERNVSSMAAETLANPKVRAILALHFGHSDRDLLVADLQKTADNSTGIARVECLKLIAKLKFNLSEEPARDKACYEPNADEPRLTIGQEFLQGGKRYRVTSIDELGRPVTADEVS